MRRLTGRPQVRWRPSLRRLRLRLPKTLRGKVLAAIVAAVLVLGLWAAFDLRTARNELLAARQGLSSAASNLGNAADSSVAATLRDATRRAVRRTERAEARITGSPVLRLAGAFPGFSTQRRGAIRAVRAARAAARIGDALAATAQREGDALTVRNGAVDPQAIRRLGDAARQAGRKLAALPPAHDDAQWGPLGHATTDLDRLLADTADRLVNGGGVMRAAASLLGADGPRRIFIALMNNAEMRDQGMVLSYAVAETADGDFRLTRSGSVTEIQLPRPVSDVALPVGTQTLFGAEAPAVLWQAVNATADRALSGALMRSMYRSVSGQQVDGVLALDVPALSALLAVTGPVDVAGIPEPITADNAAEILLDELYRVQGSENTNDARNARLDKLAATTAAVVERIRGSSVNGAAVMRALGNAARGGHTWLSVADAEGQRDLERAGIGGAPGGEHPERTIHVAVQNATPTKLDYFVDPEVAVDVWVTEDGTAIVTTTVKLRNGAPTAAPASEQFGGEGFGTAKAGDYRARVYFWGPSTGDQLSSVAESGLRLNYRTADVPAGKESEVMFTTVLPQAVRDGRFRLRLVPQPRVRPAKLQVHVAGTGWKVEEPNRAQDWDAVVDLEWRLRER